MAAGIVAFVVAGFYSWGVWRFWQGYGRTNFQPGVVNRLSLALFWPALWVINGSYRQNFQKALKGR